LPGVKPKKLDEMGRSIKNNNYESIEEDDEELSKLDKMLTNFKRKNN